MLVEEGLDVDAAAFGHDLSPYFLLDCILLNAPRGSSLYAITCPKLRSEEFQRTKLSQVSGSPT